MKQFKAIVFGLFLLIIISCSEKNNEIKSYSNPIAAGDSVSSNIFVEKINFVLDNELSYYHNVKYDINFDGIYDIQFIYDNESSNNRDLYLGVKLLNKNVEIARSLDTKNRIVSQLSQYDPDHWKGSYAFNASNVEWPMGFSKNQIIDKNYDWVNDTFYFETSSERDLMPHSMNFYSISNDEYIGLRIKTITGYSYGWLSYSHTWSWYRGDHYIKIAFNIFLPR